MLHWHHCVFPQFKSKRLSFSLDPVPSHVSAALMELWKDEPLSYPLSKSDISLHTVHRSICKCQFCILLWSGSQEAAGREHYAGGQRWLSGGGEVPEDIAGGGAGAGPGLQTLPSHNYLPLHGAALPHFGRGEHHSHWGLGSEGKCFAQLCQFHLSYIVINVARNFLIGRIVRLLEWQLPFMVGIFLGHENNGIFHFLDFFVISVSVVGFLHFWLFET